MKWLKKIDDNILKYLLALFIFFIPLYPKFPFHVVNYTYIAIRLDDFFTALLVVVFIIQLVRKKVSFQSLRYKKWFALFWVIVFASLVSGMYVTKTIDYPLVAFLHSVRRIEYMILFFIALSVIRSVNDFKFLLFSLISSLLLVNIYGLGQRFLDFPAISTMNPEFAKGRILYLTPEARLSSTFAGHYDLAAFLVFMFPILWSVFLYSKKFILSTRERVGVFLLGTLPVVFTLYSMVNSTILSNIVPALVLTFSQQLNLMIFFSLTCLLILFLVMYQHLPKILLFLLILLSIAILVFTASRTSSIAYVASTSLFLLYFRKFRYLLFVLILFGVFTYLDSDLLQRWTETIQIKQIVLNERTGERQVVQTIRSDKLPAGTAFVRVKNTKESSASEKLRQELIAKATLSGKLRTSSQSGITSADDYETVTGFAGDISITTRLQASWPRAIKAFLRNPLLGTGPSSITESSDGDYFRWIGETGALGAMAFIGTIMAILKGIFVARKKVSKDARLLLFGIIFATFGLFINAMLIDVFEASKVAYILWLSLGLYTGLIYLNEKQLKDL